MLPLISNQYRSLSIPVPRRGTPPETQEIGNRTCVEDQLRHRVPGKGDLNVTRDIDSRPRPHPDSHKPELFPYDFIVSGVRSHREWQRVEPELSRRSEFDFLGR